MESTNSNNNPGVKSANNYMTTKSGTTTALNNDFVTDN